MEFATLRNIFEVVDTHPNWNRVILSEIFVSRELHWSIIKDHRTKKQVMAKAANCHDTISILGTSELQSRTEENEEHVHHSRNVSLLRILEILKNNIAET